MRTRCRDGFGSVSTKTQVTVANGTITDLRFEFVAVKRITCMLEAFTSDDLEAQCSLRLCSTCLLG